MSQVKIDRRPLWLIDLQEKHYAQGSGPVAIDADTVRTILDFMEDEISFVDQATAEIQGELSRALEEYDICEEERFNLEGANRFLEDKVDELTLANKELEGRISELIAAKSGVCDCSCQKCKLCTEWVK